VSYDGRTRVLIKTRPEPGAVDLVMRPLPALRPDEALVRVRHAGICGTDLHIIAWNDWAARSYRPPFALGHELCGEIVDIGGSSAFRVGDRVTAETHLACGTCRQCRLGRGHVCLDLMVFSRLDRGAFADYTVVPSALLRRVPDGIPDTVAAVMEPLGIAVRNVSETGVAGHDVLVTGCGPIGLFTIAAARAFGAARIFASDPVAERRALALRAGASEAFDPTAGSIAERVMSETGGHGADVALETSGSPAAIADALRSLSSGGTVIISGLPARDVAIDLAGMVVLREITIRGVYGRRLDRTWVETERALASSLQVGPILTHSFALDDFERAIATAAAGACGKVLFEMRSAGTATETD